MRIRFSSASPWVQQVPTAVATVLLFIAPACLGDGRGGEGHVSAHLGSLPNVLILVTDDQRAAGTMGVMPKMRHWFAKGGTSYPNAFATTPMCCPARVSILTGQYAHNHGVQDNHHIGRFDPSYSVTRYLKKAGYRTAIVGKLLNGWPKTRPPPYFDRWSISSRGYKRSTFYIDGEVRSVDEYQTDFLASQATGVLRDFEEDDATPWFLYVGIHAPHTPAIPESDYAGMEVGPFVADRSVLEADRRDKPPYLSERNEPRGKVRRLRAKQLRTLPSVDDLVDEVFSTMGSLAETRRTLAFFLSDNGYLWGEHGRVGKLYPYTDSIKVPFFMRWPGHVGAGKIDRRLVANVDVSPTILDAANVNPDSSIDGRSLLNQWDRSGILLEYRRGPEHPEIPTWASLRTKSTQYIEYYGPSGAMVFREYYLEEDPWQIDNVFRNAAPKPPEIARFHRQLARYRDCRGSSCP